MNDQRSDKEKIEQEIVEYVREHKDDFLSVQDRIQQVVNESTERFSKEFDELEAKFDAMPEATEEDFTKKVHELEQRTKIETQNKLDEILADVRKQVEDKLPKDVQ